MKKFLHGMVQLTCGRGTGAGNDLSSFEFADGTTRRRTRAVTINCKAANDEIVNAWMVAT